MKHSQNTVRSLSLSLVRYGCSNLSWLRFTLHPHYDGRSRTKGISPRPISAMCHFEIALKVIQQVPSTTNGCIITWLPLSKKHIHLNHINSHEPLAVHVQVTKKKRAPHTDCVICWNVVYLRVAQSTVFVNLWIFTLLLLTWAQSRNRRSCNH